MKNLKVTVITVCLNSASLIESCIKSVLKQSYKNIEYIIIDGGSTDKTLDVINKYRNNISLVISEKDHGIYDAMNKGLNVATGEVVYFLNSDDRLFDSDVIHDIANEFMSKEGADMVYGKVWLTNLPHGSKSQICESNVLRKNDFLKNTICHQAVFVRKDLFKRIGLFNTKYLVIADFDWLVSAFECHGLKARQIDRCVAYYNCQGFSYKNLKILEKERKAIVFKHFPLHLYLWYLLSSQKCFINMNIKFKKARHYLSLKAIKKMIKILFYSGSRFYCPCCERQFRKMMPFRASFYLKGELVNQYAENIICPGCESELQDRLVVEFFKKNTDICIKPKLVLHLAPENGLRRFLFRQKQIEYTSCDIATSQFPDPIRVDMTNLQFPNNSFDIVLALHILEHIKEDVKALKELVRVLKPDGWAVINVPIYGEKTFEDINLDSEGRRRWYGSADHMRMNGLDFIDKLHSSGFSVKIYSTDDVPGEYFDRTVKSPYIESNKRLFFCKKTI